MIQNEILGMNERNLHYIRPYNKKKSIRLADDKLASKELLVKTGISTPKLYGALRTIKDFEDFDWKKLPANFVIKPNRGFGGEGIVLLRRAAKKEEFLKLSLQKREWLTNSGEIWSFEKLKSHILDILDGSFSLQGLPDTAFIERKLTTHPIFKNYTKKGIPDIRIIVFNKVPVMSMMRLPTEKSQGKANIAQGAIAVGIDMGSGVTTTAMTKYPVRKIIDVHPDTNQKLSDFQIPDWDKILEMSVEAQVASNLGYLGVDIAIDKKYGPEILELNARPGLDIQIANLEGLAGRLKRVKGLKVKSVAHGIRIAKDLFGGDVEKRVEKISNREVIGSIEKVELFSRKGDKKIEVEAKIDTGADSTSIDIELAKKMGYEDILSLLSTYELDAQLSDEKATVEAKKMKNKLQKESREIVSVTWVRSSHGLTLRPCLEISFILSGVKVISRANITERGLLKYKMIVGKKDLKRFLVDVKK
jgi:alpha-L-glutamate ligase-like protein